MWKKRKHQKWQKDCHKFVRPHTLEGIVLCMAHNPHCSGTLNEKNEQSGITLNKDKNYCQNTKNMKNKILLHGLLKSSKIKYLLLFYQSIVL